MTGGRTRFAALLCTVVVVASAGLACSTDDDASPRSSTSSTTTSVPTPSTVSNADFDDQATTAEALIRNAGTDTCKIVQAFAPASALPTPINTQQTERGVRVIAQLFDAAAAAAPPAAAADGQVLSQAAAALLAEGEAAGWQPSWLISSPKAITDAKVAQAFANYQAEASKVCASSTTTSAP